MVLMTMTYKYIQSLSRIKVCKKIGEITILSISVEPEVKNDSCSGSLYKKAVMPYILDFHHKSTTLFNIY